jgi:hypothetical protein
MCHYLRDGVIEGRSFPDVLDDKWMTGDLAGRWPWASRASGRDGKVRYAALYRDLKGRQRSAGTFTTERQADMAWQRAEASISLGRVSDPRRGRQTFQR